MLDITKDIQSLTTLRHKTSGIMKWLKETKRPMILTVNGRPEAVVQDAEAYQRLLDIAARADVAEGTRQGLGDVGAGRLTLAREGLEAFRRKHGIPH